MAERRNSGVGLHKRSSQKPLTSGGASDAQEDFETTRSATGPLVMQRGVSQLLFHYLPARTVDWENGLAIVMLTQPRLSSPVWSDESAAIVLNEITMLLERWRKKGGSVDRNFPNPITQRGSFAIGTPEAIEAKVLETAFICQNCSRLHFLKLNRLANADARVLICSECGTRALRQLGQVFVHGCGEIVPITEWIPATKKTEGASLEPTVHPLRCRNCGTEGKLALSVRSERVKDMKLECRKCGTVVQERLTARCKKCLEELSTEGHSVTSETEMIGAESDDTGTTGSVVARIAMRMTRYNANATYYAQTLSMLRLDRPQIIRSADPDVQLLRRMLPAMRRPTAERGAASTVAQLALKLKEAELNNDREAMERIRALILGALGNDNE